MRYRVQREYVQGGSADDVYEEQDMITLLYRLAREVIADKRLVGLAPMGPIASLTVTQEDCMTGLLPPDVAFLLGRRAQDLETRAHAGQP